MKSDYFQLIVKPSNIPNAGLGVFARNNLYKGQILAEYRGKIISTKYAWAQCYMLEDKMVQINDRYSVIGRALASRINDIVKFGFLKEEEEKQIEQGHFPIHKGLKHNVYLSIRYDKPFLVALQDIQQGEELYFDYSYSYWKSFYDQMKQFSGDFFKHWEQKQQEPIDQKYIIADSDTLKFGNDLIAKQLINLGEIVLECRGKVIEQQKIMDERKYLQLENQYLRLNRLSNSFFQEKQLQGESNLELQYMDKKYFIIASSMILKGEKLKLKY